MNVLAQAAASQRTRQASPIRSIARLLELLNEMSRTSPNLIVGSAGRFESDGVTYELPRYTFIGPKGGDDPIRVGIFAAIHGDEPAGAYALVQFLQILEQHPSFASGYCLFVYPLCNPTGFEDDTRNSRRGRDLNREFWKDSAEPEVRLLQAELAAHKFHGIISLHADDTSHGTYGFAHGATLTKDLLRPALAAAELLLPLNHDDMIDGFVARDGIIREGYQGILSAPPEVRPRPFEIVFETPQAAPQHLQEKALVVALEAILAEYRKFIAYAPNL